MSLAKVCDQCGKSGSVRSEDDFPRGWLLLSPTPLGIKDLELCGPGCVRDWALAEAVRRTTKNTKQEKRRSLSPGPG